MTLRLETQLETLSGRPPRPVLPGEPILFVVVLVNEGTGTVNPVSVSAQNDVCTATVRDSKGEVVGRGSLARLLPAGGRLQPPPPPPDRLQRVRLEPDERDEERGDLLALLPQRLPPGDYTLEMSYRTPDATLQAAPVALRVVAMNLVDARVSWPADRAFAHLALLVRGPEGTVELRHERRSAVHPAEILQHGFLGSVPEAVSALAETSAVVKPASEPVWIAWAAPGVLGLQKSWAGTPSGKPVRMELPGLEQPRLLALVERDDRTLFAALTGSVAGEGSVLEVVEMGPSGEPTGRERVGIGPAGMLVAGAKAADDGLWMVATATSQADGVLLESLTVPIARGGRVSRSAAGRVEGSVVGLAAGSAGRIAAVIQRPGPRGPALLLVRGRAAPEGEAAPKIPDLAASPIVLSPPPLEAVRDVRIAMDQEGQAWCAVSSANGDVYAGRAEEPLTWAARKVRWPSQGMSLIGPIPFPRTIVVGYVSRDEGLALSRLP